MKKITYLISIFFLLIVTCYAQDIPTEVQEQLETEFNTYFPNNEITLNAFNPSNDQDFFSLLSIKATEQNINNLYYHNRITNCNERYTECDATIKKHNGSTDYYTYTKRIKIKYANLDTKVSKKINKLIDNYKEKYKDKTIGEYILKDIRITDLDLINYFYYSYKEGDDPTSKEFPEVKSINFITELKEDFENGNIKYKFITNGCDLNLQLFTDSHTQGTLFLYYGDVIYGALQVDLGYNNIIYIPSNTPKDEQSTLNAVKERLNKYFKKDFDITISRETKIDNDEMWAVGGGDITRFGDFDTMSKYIYNLNINGIEYEFLIIRDSKKMINEKFKTKDLKSDISVTLEYDSIPFDTLISSNNIIDNEKYKKIIGNDNVFTYDINLHSQTLNSNISKIEKGKFIVSIPVPKNLQGKKIVAYYINNLNELEKHEVTVESEFATFETNHFSIYSLAEVEEMPTENNQEQPLTDKIPIENPNTSDNIKTIIIKTILLAIALLTLVRIMKKTKKYD